MYTVWCVRISIIRKGLANLLFSSIWWMNWPAKGDINCKFVESLWFANLSIFCTHYYLCIIIDSKTDHDWSWYIWITKRFIDKYNATHKHSITVSCSVNSDWPEMSQFCQQNFWNNMKQKERIKCWHNRSKIDPRI